MAETVVIMYVPSTIFATWDGIFVVACAALAPLLFVSEAFSFMNFGYSKFSNVKDRSRKLPSKVGMFILYFPAALVFPIAAAASGYGTSAWPDTSTAFHRTTAIMITAHFFKRCLEVVFLHRFSGHTNLLSCVTICILYFGTAFLFYFVAAHRLSSPAGLASAQLQGFAPNYHIGISLWLCGMLGNFYHHWLLAKLRAQTDTSYKVPAGALFSVVCCPHYLFELLGWCGVAVAFSHALGYTVLWMMCNYLLGRSHVTLKWYHDKASVGVIKKPLPSGWKRIVPFVF